MYSTARSAAAAFVLLAPLCLTAPAALANGTGWVLVSDQNEDFFWSYPAGRTSVNHTGVGQYAVTFFGLGNSLNSNVQVNAWQYSGQNLHYCISAGWSSSNGTDVTAYVNCYGMNGALQDGDFSAFYQTRTSAPASGTVNFVWGNQPTTTSYTPSAFYSYNTSGGINTVFRNGTGNYFVYMPGYHGTGGNAQVTAYGSSAARCEVVDWYHNLSGINVSIQCVNASGNPADEYFSLAFTANATEASGPSTNLGGYAWANNPGLIGTYIPATQYNWNDLSTKKLNVQNIGGGVSFLNMRLPPGSPSFNGALGMVTAYGSSGEFCLPSEQGYFGSAKHEVFTVFVNCFDKTGAADSADYSGTIVTGN